MNTQSPFVQILRGTDINTPESRLYFSVHYIMINSSQAMISVHSQMNKENAADNAVL